MKCDATRRVVIMKRQYTEFHLRITSDDLGSRAVRSLSRQIQ
jgi:hypothetical protein